MQKTTRRWLIDLIYPLPLDVGMGFQACRYHDHFIGDYRQQNTMSDLQNVNQYRKSVWHPEFGNLDDPKRYLLTIPDLVVDFEEQITRLIFDKRSKKEIQKAIEQRRVLKDGTQS